MDNNDRSGRLAAGFMGALLGLITGATLTFMSDQGNRDKVKKRAGDMGDDANKKLQDLKLSVAKTNKATRKKMAKNLRTFATQLEAK